MPDKDCLTRVRVLGVLSFRDSARKKHISFKANCLKKLTCLFMLNSFLVFFTITLGKCENGLPNSSHCGLTALHETYSVCVIYCTHSVVLTFENF